MHMAWWAAATLLLLPIWGIGGALEVAPVAVLVGAALAVAPCMGAECMCRLPC